jgi:hypothetical protein
MAGHVPAILVSAKLLVLSIDCDTAATGFIARADVL